MTDTTADLVRRARELAELARRHGLNSTRLAAIDTATRELVSALADALERAEREVVRLGNCQVGLYDAICELYAARARIAELEDNRTDVVSFDSVNVLLADVENETAERIAAWLDVQPDRCYGDGFSPAIRAGAWRKDEES